MKSTSELSRIANCKIDPHGVFKYIQIKINDKSESKYLVRGYLRHEYHADNYKDFKSRIGFIN